MQNDNRQQIPFPKIPLKLFTFFIVKISHFRAFFQKNFWFDCPQEQNGPRQANLVLIVYASSEGSGEPAQSRQNLRCSLIQAVSQEEPSDRKSDPWLL